MKPSKKPQNICFSSGPCAKFPGWNLVKLDGFNPGRSHRAKSQKAKLANVIEKTKSLLQIPEDYVVGIMPGSDTGAVEAALWTMLGQRGVDVLSWESFSEGWASDIKNELKLEDVRYFNANYGQLPKLEEVDSDRDVVFAYNGTTSGVRLPNCDFIKDNRQGLTICDATSALFAMDVPWRKLDVTTFSWQKVMGSEAAHGMIILSPRAVNRLETYTPNRPIPKIFTMAKKGKLISGIFNGATVNTPSMLAVEDAHVTLKWIEEIGGLSQTIKRSESNLTVIKNWVHKTDWVEFLAESEDTISNTSICLKIVDPNYLLLDTDNQGKFAKDFVKQLESDEVALDVGSYRDAPPGIRIWGGATIESSDLSILTEWLDYTFSTITKKFSK